MVLSITKMVGDFAYGYDGYNKRQEGIRLDPKLASRIREELWYVTIVVVEIRD